MTDEALIEGRLRLIIYPKDPSTLAGLARIARYVLAPDYEWPSDGIALIHTEAANGNVVCAASLRKNKRSITIWEQ